MAVKVSLYIDIVVLTFSGMKVKHVLEQSFPELEMGANVVFGM